MAVLVGWTQVSSTAPGTQLQISYDWNASTRQYTVYLQRRCGNSGAWWNSSWSGSISTTYGNHSGTVKRGTSGTIGQTVYTLTGGPWTIPNGADRVDISINSNGSISGTLVVGYGWVAPSKTFRTYAQNNTSGNSTNSGY